MTQVTVQTQDAATATAPRRASGTQATRGVVWTGAANLGGHAPLRSAYYRTLELLALLAAPITAGAILVAAPGIQLLRGERWADVSLAAQILSAGLIFRFQYAVALALIQAHGWWRMWALVLLSEGLGNVIAGGIGALLGDLETIAWTMTVYRIGVSIVIALMGARLAGLPFLIAIKTTVPALLRRGGQA